MSKAMEKFGKYILFERLASGGMAEVYLSKSIGAEGVNKVVAIKRILPQFSDSPEFIDMFKEEAKIAVNLNHGNVVSIHEFGVEKDQFYLVMEYVDGKNLRQILNEFKKTTTFFSVEQIVYIIKEVAAGLDYAHRCVDGTTGRPLNIVHRDMSPQNIMISYEGGVKIIDFGIAKAETQLDTTKVGTLKGKYSYMSPEQAEGLPVDARTDVFSVGIVLWELLANERLFAGNSETIILNKIRSCQVPAISKLNPSVSAELESIVNKTLAKDKNLRYQTAAELNRDLNRFLNKNYPDFSQNEFSRFMKNNFSTSFLEQRQKIIEYSKAQSDRFIETTPNPQKNLTTAETIVNNDKSTAITSTEVSVTLEKPSAPQNGGFYKPAGLPKNDSVSSVQNTFKETYVGNKAFSKTITQNTPIRRPQPRPQEKTGNSFLVFTLVIGFALGGWWYLNRPQLPLQISRVPKVESGLQATTETPPAPSINQQTDLAEMAPEYVVQIRSNPDKARIVINGEDAGGYTPMRKSLKANVPVNIRLVKEGYSDFVTTYTPTTDVGLVDGNLQRLAKLASMYVKIVNGGANPELRISGVPVDIKSETEPYLIQAEVNVKIQALNKLTGLSVEKTIMIHADQKETVELYLK